MESMNNKYKEPLFAKLKTGETVLILDRIDHDNRKKYVEPNGVYVAMYLFHTGTLPHFRVQFPNGKKKTIYATEFEGIEEPIVV